MTTEEKLQHFHDVCMEDAKEHYQKVLTEYRTGLLSDLEAHKEDEKRRQEMRLQVEAEKIARTERRELSADQMRLRKEISGQQEHYREQLFSEVSEKLSAFRKTDAYLELLKRQIEEIRTLSGGEDYEVCVGAEDQALLPQLPAGTGCSEETLVGGVMGVIPAKNILIDHSFRTRLQEEKRAFRFMTGGGHGKD